MKKRDFRKAFGTPDAAFVSTVENTLRRLREEEERPVKRKLRFSAAIAIAACLILTAVAFAAANHWGLFDFLDHKPGGSGVLPEAADIVATDPPQEGGAGELASFKLREAVYDGEYIYMVVEATPREGLLLCGPSSGPKDPMRDLTGDASLSMTIDEYARQNDLQMASVHIGASGDALGNGFINSIDYHMEEDGTLLVMLAGTVPEGASDTFADVLQCSVTPLVPAIGEDDAITYGYYEPDGDDPVYASTGYTLDQENRQETELSFTLSLGGPYEALYSAQNAEYPLCGVRVDSVAFTASPMALYYEVRFTVIDETAYAATEEGVWFEFLDENGDALPGGATLSGSIDQEADGSFVQSGSLAAREDMPETVVLRAYNCWTKERYETNELTLNP